MTLEQTREALRRHESALLARGNVVATGIGYKVTGGVRSDTLCVVCSVTSKQAYDRLAARDLVPQTLDGVPTDVVETGVIRALASRTDRVRPAPGGVSIGHHAITAGTLGCIVRKDGERVILSNNHVLANSNDASVGDAILQPGPLDGGTLPDDQIATLREFVPIQFPEQPSDCPFAGSAAATLNGLGGLLGSRTRLRAVRPQADGNRVDAAVARPLDDMDVSDAILELGTLEGVASGELGMSIAKSGRTTELTRGEISQIDVTVDVQYGAGRVARFQDQLLAGPMSQGGDSGSAVLDTQNRLVGLLFAGSDSTTILNRIEHVFEELGLEL
jgi:hypothetical protein